MGKLRHKDIWAGIDRLAAKAKLSPSGLARRAGLDPTSFNISKRNNPQGNPRWPTTESISKILSVTETTLADFVALIGRPAGARTGRRYVACDLAKAGLSATLDDAGSPAGSGWRNVDGPDVDDDTAYALQIKGNSMRPLFRAGDMIIVSPKAAAERGDRVIVKTRAGKIMAKEVVRQTKRLLELRSFNADGSDPAISADDVLWMHRLAWVSQ